MSTNNFLVATCIPVYGLLMYARYRYNGDVHVCACEDDSIFSKEISKMEEDVMKPSEETFSWKTLKLYRHLVIVIIRTFIINPVYRSITFLPLLIIILLQDKYTHPYKSRYLNILQVSSSTCLLLVLGCNTDFSFLAESFGILVPYMDTVVKVLTYMEVTLYVLMPLPSLISYIHASLTSRN